MPKMSETSMFANDPSIRRRLIDFFSSRGFIAEPFQRADHSISTGAMSRTPWVRAAFARNRRFWGYVLWRWLHTLHQQHCSRVLLNRQQSFMRMQKQQRQLPGFSLGDGA
jgi:hypothetical protein